MINPDDFEPGMAPIVALDEEGREIPDPTPIVIHLPTGPVTDYDRVRELIRRELSFQMAAEGMETEEEANDFDVDDDLFPVSPHEYSEGTEAADIEALNAEAARRDRANKRKKKDDRDIRSTSTGKPVEVPGESEGVADPLDPDPENSGPT